MYNFIKKRLFFWILGILSLLAVFLPYTYAGSAMGVSPADYEIIYKKGGLIFFGDLQIYTPDPKYVRLSMRGSLAPYIHVPLGIQIDNDINIFNVEGSGYMVQYNVTLPPDIKPGVYEGEIIVSQYLRPEDKVGMMGFGGFAAVSQVLKLRVPNDGRYLEGKITYQPDKVNLGTVVYFTMKMLNFGTEDLNDLQGQIIVTDRQGKLISQTETGKIATLPAGERGEIQGFWKTQGSSAGIYDVQAVVEYGGIKPMNLTTDVKVGDITLKITNISTNMEGAIAKIFIDLESNWNDDIPSVYAVINIRNASGVLDTVKTSSIDIGPWGKGNLIGFWEKGKLGPGNYKMDIYVYYFDKRASKEMSVRIDADEKKAPKIEMDGSKWFIVAIVGLGVILIVNILWFVLNLKKSKKKK
jgi:hypothetical protein